MNRSEPDNTDNVRSFVRKTQKIAVTVGTVIGVLLMFFCSGSVGYGFMSGAGVSIINFQLMAVDAYRTIDSIPVKARKFIMGRYSIRYALMAGFIILIVTRTNFNIFAACAGLFLVQMILVGGRLAHIARIAVKTSRG